jgi:hypothetical protein
VLLAAVDIEARTVTAGQLSARATRARASTAANEPVAWAATNVRLPLE